MIRVLIFDFDGIILESSQIKTEAYRELFEDASPLVFEKIMEYHLRNMGFSRQRVFKHYYEEIIGTEASHETIEKMSQEFKEIVLSKVLMAPYVAGVIDFLKTVQKKYNLYVATGTPDSEIKQIAKERNVDKYFVEVYGSPLDKESIIKSILTDQSISNSEALLFGDAESDRIAAENTGIHFIGRMGPGFMHLKQATPLIKDFSNIEDICKMISGIGENL